MPVQMCPIDIPDGWEFVKLKELMHGDTYLSMTGEVGIADRSDEYNKHVRVILRPAWQWPEWLTAECVAMDSGGVWFSYQYEPRKTHTGWVLGGDFHRLVLTAFTPPPCDDWTKSLRKNPRSK